MSWEAFRKLSWYVRWVMLDELGDVVESTKESRDSAGEGIASIPHNQLRK